MAKRVERSTADPVRSSSARKKCHYPLMARQQLGRCTTTVNDTSRFVPTIVYDQLSYCADRLDSSWCVSNNLLKLFFSENPPRNVRSIFIALYSLSIPSGGTSSRDRATRHLNENDRVLPPSTLDGKL